MWHERPSQYLSRLSRAKRFIGLSSTNKISFRLSKRSRYYEFILASTARSFASFKAVILFIDGKLRAYKDKVSDIARLGDCL